MKDVGATLVVALLPTDEAHKPGDHKGRPYIRQRRYSARSPRERILAEPLYLTPS